MRRKFFFQQNDTKINDFDEGVLILEPFFWSNVIFQICFFCIKSHDIKVGRNFFECLPRIVTLQSYIMNASLYSCCLRFSKQEQTLYLGKPNNGTFSVSHVNVTFETEVANFENDIASERTAIKSKRLHQNWWSWCHLAGKMNFIRNNAHNFIILSLIFLK